MTAEEAASLPWTRRTNGLALSVRLTPKSARDALEGIERLADGRSVIKARVRAVPEAGAANEALLRLMAKSLDLPVRAIHLESGATSRVKVVLIEAPGEDLEARLLQLFG
jgi:uncharacterized protein